MCAASVPRATNVKEGFDGAHVKVAGTSGVPVRSAGHSSSRSPQVTELNAPAGTTTCPERLPPRPAHGRHGPVLRRPGHPPCAPRVRGAAGSREPAYDGKSSGRRPSSRRRRRMRRQMSWRGSRRRHCGGCGSQRAPGALAAAGDTRRRQIADRPARRFAARSFPPGDEGSAGASPPLPVAGAVDGLRSPEYGRKVKENAYLTWAGEASAELGSYGVGATPVPGATARPFPSRGSSDAPRSLLRMSRPCRGTQAASWAPFRR